VILYQDLELAYMAGEGGLSRDLRENSDSERNGRMKVKGDMEIWMANCVSRRKN